MRAIVVNKLGGPDVLTLAGQDPPQPGTGQLLVDVAAAGVNYMDVYLREGRPPYGRELPFVPGAEGAGTVASLGPGVDGFAVGDQVAWVNAPGSYAEQVLVPAAFAVRIPAGVDTQVAAAVMLQGITAHYLCHSTYPVGQGDVVVVHAAAGGVGLLLTQMVKMRGGVIVATTSTTAKAVLAQQAGADRVTGYQDFGAVVREVTGGAGAAAAYDGVGQATFEQSMAAVRQRGLLVLFGASSGPVPPFELQRLAGAGSLFITRPTMAHYIATRDELLWRTGDLFSWVGQGRLSVRISATYPLADAARAHDDLTSRRTTGKLLLLPR